MEVKELEARIEKAYETWELAKPEVKDAFAREVQALALDYKEFTGNYYFRDINVKGGVKQNG